MMVPAQAGANGTVEVIGRDVGYQIVDERQVLTDITYDRATPAPRRIGSHPRFLAQP